MKRALITGICGFAGSWLAAELLREGYEVFGIDRNGGQIANPAAAKMLPDPDALRQIRIFANDLGSASELQKIFSELGPCTIFHLAGTAFVPDSWKSPLASLDNNAVTTLRLIEGAHSAGWQGRFLFVSSSDVYGMPQASGEPITETTRPDPQSPYAQSKLCAESYLRFYSGGNRDYLIARPFNHSGPAQRDAFVIPAFVKRVKEALAGQQDSIPVGDLDAFRDFSDVRDVVWAYRLIAEKGAAGEVYNICSGQKTQIRELLQIILEIAGAELQLKTEDSLLRHEGPSVRYGSPKKLMALGWSPRFSLRDTIQAVWEAADL